MGSIVAFTFVISIIFCVLLVLWAIPRFKINVDRLDYVTLYFGPPGCGKTTFLAKIASQLQRKNTDVFSNVPIDGCYAYSRSDIGKFSFPENSILLFDEGSLNGYDNRDHKDNFKGNHAMDYFKLIRHYKNKIIFSNQGWDELDKKIRTLTVQLWYVRSFGPFSYAMRIFKSVDVDEESKQIVDGYVLPSKLKLIFCSSYTQIVYRPKYYRYFDSYSRPELPEMEKTLYDFD